MLYKYEFSLERLKDDYQNRFCYYTQTSVLDIKKASPQILLYEIARAIGDKDLAKAAEKLKEIADALANELYGSVHRLENLRGNGRFEEKPDVVSTVLLQRCTEDPGNFTTIEQVKIWAPVILYQITEATQDKQSSFDMSFPLNTNNKSRRVANYF